jgi:DNA-binding CsgD family transcriptional regulator
VIKVTYWMRFAIPEDVPACVAMVPHVFGSTKRADLRSATHLWQRLLKQGRALCAVVVDATNHPVAFGLSTFISNEFRAMLMEGGLPPMGMALQLWAGRDSILRSDAIQRAHQGEGLNLLGFYGWRTDLPPDALKRAHAMLWASFVPLHRGYHLRSFLKEVYGEQERERYTRVGFTIYWQRPAVHIVPPRYLVGIERDAVDYASPLGALFQAAAPAFTLSRRQREICQLGYLLRLTNTQIAQCLGIDVDTVYVHWSRLAKRLNLQGLPSEAHGRGAVMRCVAHHPELIYPLLIHTRFYHQPHLAHQHPLPVLEDLPATALVQAATQAAPVLSGGDAD